MSASRSFNDLSSSTSGSHDFECADQWIDLEYPIMTINGQELLNRIQKSVGVPWQSQRPDGFADGFLAGKPDVVVTGIVTTYTPSLAVIKRAVASGKNTIICREAPYYSRGERMPVAFRNGPAPSTQALEQDPVYRAKQEFIAQNNVLIIRLLDNWDARPIDGQLRGLTRALGWEKYHSPVTELRGTYDPRNIYFELPAKSIENLAAEICDSLKIKTPRVIGNPQSKVSRVALSHGLLLVSDAERMLRKANVDLVIAGDAVEWEAGPYFQDLVTAGMAKGLILLGDEASEEPGSNEMASWLKGFITEVPVEWISAGEPFRRLNKE